MVTSLAEHKDGAMLCVEQADSRHEADLENDVLG